MMAQEITLSNLKEKTFIYSKRTFAVAADERLPKSNNTLLDEDVMLKLGIKPVKVSTQRFSYAGIQTRIVAEVRFTAQTVLSGTPAGNTFMKALVVRNLSLCYGVDAVAGGQLYNKLLGTENDDSLVIFSSQPKENSSDTKRKKNSIPQLIQSPKPTLNLSPEPPSPSSTCDGFISAMNCRPGTPPTPYTAACIQNNLENLKCDTNQGFVPMFLDVQTGCFKPVTMAAPHLQVPTQSPVSTNPCNLYTIATTPPPSSGIIQQVYWLNQGGCFDRWDYDRHRPVDDRWQLDTLSKQWMLPYLITGPLQVPDPLDSQVKYIIDTDGETVSMMEAYSMFTGWPDVDGPWPEDPSMPPVPASFQMCGPTCQIQRCNCVRQYEGRDFVS